MSAAADFAEWISDLNDAPLPGASHGEIWAKVKEFRAEVAKELAEKQRAHAVKHGTVPQMMAASELIDIIDPEESDSG